MRSPPACDLHIHNARIWTGDTARPWANGITISGGRVVSLGNDEATVSRGRAGTSVVSPAVKARAIDARGRVIVPGLIDSHMHLLMGGRSLSELDLSHVRSREEFEQAIARAHAQLPPGRWLIARGWSQENWPDRAMPDKSWLAACKKVSGVRCQVTARVQEFHESALPDTCHLSPDTSLETSLARPCVCYRMDMHAAVVNEPVLEMCGAAKRSDPEGGCIVRVEDREPTGLMIEAALWQLVNPLIPEPDAQAKRECLLSAQKHCHAMGLTAVGSMEYARDVEEVYCRLREQLTLRCRLTLLDRDWGGRPMSFDYGRDFPADDRLAVIGYKAYIDGTLGSRTARMLADYADDPGNRGMLVELAAAGTLRDWACAVADAGLSPSMHAIGDEAARLALDMAQAVAGIDRVNERDSRPRIEHAQQIDAEDIPRFRGRIASMQPLHKADDARYVERRLGSERTAGTFAFRRLLDAGAMLAFGSDWPVVSCDPILGMRAAITGLTLDDKPFGIEQNLTVEETLRAYTAGAAHCLQLDALTGVLSEGMLGDLVMFDIDPFTADWAKRPPRVIMTVIGGEVMFDATQE
jgi:predicted amidohydrolase YtcJ